MATPEARPVLAIGPANHAGQAFEWANAVRRTLSVDAWAFAHREFGPQPPFTFPADKTIGRVSYRNPLCRGFRSRLFFRGVTHVAIDGFLPYFHLKMDGKLASDLRWLADNGRQVALIAHGTDVRDPHGHQSADPWSYYGELEPGLVNSIGAHAAHHRMIAEASGLPVFYSTPDLAADLPTGTWLPVAVDVDSWATDSPVLERPVPRVLHVPSSARVKGSHHIDPVLAELDSRGLIEYVSPKSVTRMEMRALVQSCDIVVEQILLGSYGVAAVEAMAAGRLVVGRVRNEVRDQMPEAPPIIDADPSSLAAVMLSVLECRDDMGLRAEEGVTFARRWHDGVESAQRLASFLVSEG